MLQFFLILFLYSSSMMGMVKIAVIRSLLDQNNQSSKRSCAEEHIAQTRRLIRDNKKIIPQSPCSYGKHNKKEVDVITRLQSSYDLKLATPTDIDQLFAQQVTADPQTDFKEYVRQVQRVRDDLKNKGLYTAQQVPLFIKGVTKSFVKGLANIAQHPDLYNSADCREQS